MTTIGVFHPTNEGGWAGTLRTLSLEARLRFVPNDNRATEAAPAFRIFAGDSEVGAAWRRQSAGEQPREYLSVSLDDPAWSQPVAAALFDSSPTEAHLVWNRRRLVPAEATD